MENGHIRQEWYRRCEEYHQIQYPLWWDVMQREWNDGEFQNSFWHVGSTSYYIRLNETSFLVDPVWLIPGAFDQVSDRLESSFRGLDLVIFTHEHGDHFMPEQIHRLRELPIRWIVPRCMEELVLRTGIPSGNCIVMDPGDEIRVKDIRIKGYAGHHHYLDGSRGPESMMYTVESQSRKLFFPADVRDFDPAFIPEGMHFDAVFMHMYLSRANGYDYPFSEYYERYVNYVSALDTEKIFIGHLYGFQCGHPDKIWNYMHAGMIQDGLFCLRPEIEVIVPRVGRRYDL